MAEWRPQRSNGARAGAVAAIFAAAVTVIAPFEGRVLHTYPDVVYGWKLTTACDGHTGPELRPGQTFTPAECDEMRQADLVRIYEGIEPCFADARMTTNELGAYLSLGFNIGARALCASSIPRKVKAGQHAQACETILEFNKSGGKVLAGLVRRRRAEAELCLSGL